MAAFTIDLGTKVKDAITGFKGTVIGRTEYITGCNQYLISPTVTKEGALKDSSWFDEQRLQVQAGAPMRLDNTRVKGPDKPAPLKP